MKTTLKFRKVSCYIEIKNLQELIPTEGCYLGWQESLCHLAQLVEPEILE